MVEAMHTLRRCHQAVKGQTHDPTLATYQAFTPSPARIRFARGCHDEGLTVAVLQ